VYYADCRQKRSFRTNISAPLSVIFLLHQWHQLRELYFLCL
jgi:hypothetical protein